MSNIVAAMVWQLKPEAMASNPKFLMVSLADQSNDDGLTVYLRGGIPALARRCAFSERTCQRLLAFLIDNRWVSVAAKESYHRPRTYQINLSKLKSNKFRGDNLSPLEPGRGDNLSPLEPGRGDNLSPLEPGRGDNGDVLGVTMTTLRGDNDDTHSFTCITSDKNIKKEGGSIIQGKSRTNGAPSLLSASPSQKKTEGPAYRKLAETCGIHLPATEREDAWLRTALRDLKTKMESDDAAEGEPVTSPMAVQAIASLIQYWKSKDWRGQKGETPSPAQLVESYGAAKVWLRT